MIHFKSMFYRSEMENIHTFMLTYYNVLASFITYFPELLKILKINLLFNISIINFFLSFEINASLLCLFQSQKIKQGSSPTSTASLKTSDLNYSSTNHLNSRNAHRQMCTRQQMLMFQLIMSGPQPGDFDGEGQAIHGIYKLFTQENMGGLLPHTLQATTLFVKICISFIGGL